MKIGFLAKNRVTNTWILDPTPFGIIMNNNTIVIMGNGPSLKEIMNNPKYLQILKNNDTFGLNAAYRIYDKYDFRIITRIY